MEYHDNNVTFSVIPTYSLISGSYTIESFSITEGQDPKGHIFVGLVVVASKGVFTFSVGRQGSTQVAGWFNGQVKPAQTTFGHTAEELNFAFLGTLVLTVSAVSWAATRKYLRLKKLR